MLLPPFPLAFDESLNYCLCLVVYSVIFFNYLLIYLLLEFVEFCISELPPPPINVQSADVKQTEAVVTWSHPEFYDMYAISSYSLQVRKLRTKMWTQFTTTRGEHHRLTKLDPDTVYFVRLKSENKYGKGKPSESGELRTEKGMLLFLLLGTSILCILSDIWLVLSLLFFQTAVPAG